MQQLFPTNTTTPAIDVDPQAIKVRQVPTSVIANLQPQMSKAVWRPAPGRKLGFLIEHKEHLLGIAFLASPVINMKPRDHHLNLSSNPTEKGKQLRHYADLSVCVPSQPFGWHWNGGKLVALIATTLGDAWLERYGDNLKGICTTSLWGRGSQYNRIYKFLGYTQGFGHEHITDEAYKNMMDWMTTHNIPIPSSRFGQGSNARMRRISAYRKASGDKTVHLRHGNKRGIYYHPANEPHDRQQIIINWYNRWGKPRFDRTRNQTPPYTDGLTNKEPQ
jgi:hypothetical protein